ncbi:hypothetical protein N7478_000710 [Penicillium angulare]|uniref:uncharacterized protein n=1 Tax=Penicillium angulare TaxID=116970 RepID=UPI002540F825|nr:uncharacterized protein N7478_000710 [Penicillium angulare]KAJ5291459.1 hypothetical protein N7478_000710 [Penicillium angulare]
MSFRQVPDPRLEIFCRILQEVQGEFSKLEDQAAEMSKELEELHAYTAGLYQEYKRVALELDIANNSGSL